MVRWRTMLFSSPQRCSIVKVRYFIFASPNQTLSQPAAVDQKMVHAIGPYIYKYPQFKDTYIHNKGPIRNIQAIGSANSGPPWVRHKHTPLKIHQIHKFLSTHTLYKHITT